MKNTEMKQESEFSKKQTLKQINCETKNDNSIDLSWYYVSYDEDGIMTIQSMF